MGENFMKLVCFSAQLGTGKDVAADYLCPKLNDLNLGRWERTAFADAVKNLFCNAFGVDRNFIENWKRNPEPPPRMEKNVRQALQFIGDGFRTIQGDIWIEIALREENKQFVLSDSRYINEARHVHHKGGINVVLYRPGFLNDDPNPSEAQIRPIVEWCLNTQKEGAINHNIGNGPDGIEFYDYFLMNDGTIDDFYSKIDRLLIPYVQQKYSYST